VDVRKQEAQVARYISGRGVIMVSQRGALMLVCLFFVLVVSVSEGLAQYTTGTVQGTVFDPDGAVVPRASVALRSIETNVVRKFTTLPDGVYSFAAVAPGRYELTVEALGFRKSVAQFTAAASQVVTQDVTLGVAGGQEIVEVRSEAAGAELNKTDSQLSTTRQAIEVNELPTTAAVLGLQTHTVLGLAIYAPGVQPMYNPRGGSLVKLTGAQTGQIASNGGRAEFGNIELDFTDANDWEFGGFALGTIPSTDFIQEFKILTSNVSAEYGIKASGQAMMITKSGTNTWHGDAGDYIQNDYFNARDWNDKTGRAARTNIHNYGISMGGPIRREKTWLFGGWHQNKNIGAGGTYMASVPTEAALATVTDPAILSIINQYLPLPTQSTSNPLIGTYPVSYAVPAEGYQFLIRGDHRLTDSQTLSVRYFHNTSTAARPYIGSLVGLDDSGATLAAKARNVNITHTWLLSEETINQLRIGYARSAGLLSPQARSPGPYFTITGVLNFGEYGGFPQGRVFNVYQVNDVVSQTRGRHQLSAGFDARIIRDNSTNSGAGQYFVRGYLVFPSINEFLAGQPSTYSQLFGPSAQPFRTKLFSAFLQDTYRLMPTLTLNLGVRWEYQGALDAGGGNFSLLDTTQPGSIGKAGSGPLGAFHVGNPIVHANPHNVAPRIGFAWNPWRSSFVVRGGYGIYYNSFSLGPLAAQGRSSPPVAYNASLTNFSEGNALGALLAGVSPFQQQWASQAATGSFGNLTYFGSLTTANAHLRNPYMQQYDLLAEYKLSPSMLITAGYIGSKGTSLAALIPINSFNSFLLPAPATSAADQTARLAQFQAAFAKEASGALRRDSRFGQVNLISDAASSSYNSLQVSFTRSMSRGLMMQASYTWSKSIDNSSTSLPTQDYLGDGVPQQANDLSRSRAVSNFDIPHRFLLTSIWQIPFFNSRTDRFSTIVLKGWQFETVNTWQSGVPISIFSGPILGITDVNFDGNTTGGAALDNTLADCSVGGTGMVLPSGFSSKYTFSQPLLGNNGTCPRNAARQPGLLNFNWSVSKSFLLKTSAWAESGPWNLQLRLQAYNVFNNPSFYVASINNLYISNPTTFGKTSPLPQRKVELAVRLVW
jgi:hypothetical protein